MNPINANPPQPPSYRPPGESHPQFNMAPQKEPRIKDWAKLVSAFFVFIVTPVLIAFFLSAFVIQSYQVDGQSMETTLQNRDRLIVYKFPRTFARITRHQYVPQRGNIVIFNQSGLPDSLGDKQLIKRVIGLPGERVVIKDNLVTVYNQQHPGGFNPDKTTGYKITATTSPGDLDVTLAKDEIFVLGDNRPNSEDSHIFGPVQLNNVVGVLALRILPLGKAESF